MLKKGTTSILKKKKKGSVTASVIAWARVEIYTHSSWSTAEVCVCRVGGWNSLNHVRTGNRKCHFKPQCVNDIIQTVMYDADLFICHGNFCYCKHGKLVHAYIIPYINTLWAVHWYLGHLCFNSKSYVCALTVLHIYQMHNHCGVRFFAKSSVQTSLSIIGIIEDTINCKYCTSVPFYMHTSSLDGLQHFSKWITNCLTNRSIMTNLPVWITMDHVKKVWCRIFFYIKWLCCRSKMISDTTSVLFCFVYSNQENVLHEGQTQRQAG